MIPDVSGVADPMASSLVLQDTHSLGEHWLDTWADNWPRGGGTSLATPIWAGFAAVYNQYAASHGEASLGLANPAIYYLGEHPNQLAANPLRDVRLNPSRTADLAAGAEVGWDAASGWGSLNAAAFIQDRLGVRLSIEPMMETGGIDVLAVASGFPIGESVSFTMDGTGPACLVKTDNLGVAQCQMVRPLTTTPMGGVGFEATDSQARLTARATLDVSVHL